MSQPPPRAAGESAKPRSVSWLLAAVGVAIVGAGLVLFAEPGFAGGLPLAGYALPALGGLSVLLGLLAVRRRLRATFDHAVPPAPEERESLSVPGDEFDAALFSDPGTARGSGSSREEIAERLRRTTLAVLERYEGLSREEAERRVAAGTWTEDPQAAAFFTGEAADASLTERLRRSMGPESVFQRRARHVVRALFRRIDRATDGASDEGNEGGERA